ncbi:MAG: TIR domain-containing protein [Dechloromonas sp.]|nr:TIR domain-containing protein [Dechloromonas sp.]
MPQSERKHLFVSYAQSDSEVVDSFVDLLRRELEMRQVGLDIWMDRRSLKPGEQWDRAIHDAVMNSRGMLVFVSPAAMKSNWVRNELLAAAADNTRLIVPVIIGHVEDMPKVLAERQWLDISSARFDKDAMHSLANRLASDIRQWLQRNQDKAPLQEDEASKFASAAANAARNQTANDDIKEQTPPDSVFVVHGHDHHSLELVCDALTILGIRPVVLSELQGQAQSLLQKFFTTSKEARFALVILSSDDYGASREQYETKGVATKALQFRARQNVLLELGFFYGHLGWENVFVLEKKPTKNFPNFERPSDLAGAVFDLIDDAGKWRRTLATRLQNAGFNVDEARTVQRSDASQGTPRK